MSGRVKCRAVVTVTLDVEVDDQWDCHDLRTLYEQAARNARLRVTKACEAFATVHTATVRSVLTEAREVDVPSG